METTRQEINIINQDAESEFRLNHVSVTGLIYWIFEKEHTSDNLKTGRKVGSVLLGLHQQSNLRQFKVSLSFKGGGWTFNVEPTINIIDIIGKYLLGERNPKSMENMALLSDRHYKDALMEIDRRLFAARSESSNLMTQKIELNNEIYDEIFNVTKLLFLEINRLNDIPSKTYSRLLLRRVGDIYLEKRCLRGFEYFDDIKFSDEKPYGIILSSETIVNSSTSQISTSRLLQQQCNQLQAENNQLIARIVELESQLSKKQNSGTTKNEISESEKLIKDSDLLLIAALLQMLKNEIKLKSNKTQAKIVQKIEDDNKGLVGLSTSRTTKILSAANKLYNSLKDKQIK